MGRFYSTQFSAVAVTALQDFFEINVASTKVVVLHELHLSQYSDVGDAQEEILPYSIQSGYTVSGSGGTTPTAVPRLIGDAAYAGTIEANNTTKANTGSPVTHEAKTFNIRVGLDRIWTPETRIWIVPSGRLVIRLDVAPADSITMYGNIIFEEIG